MKNAQRVNFILGVGCQKRKKWRIKQIYVNVKQMQILATHRR